MIAGATRGAGGPALGRHLAKVAGNDAVIELDGRGLITTGIRSQVAELTRLGSHARTRTPLYHVHADPPADRPWTMAERDEYWHRFEAEFGLAGRPFAAVGHLKDGRLHEHRVYLRVHADGTAIRLDHDHARREKLGRLFEFDRGEVLVAGAHGRAVAAALEREGRADVAAAMRASGVLDGPRPRARLTPAERHQQERTDVTKGDVGSAVLAAWQSADNGRAFQAALAASGLRLAVGDSTPQLVDGAGGSHDLRRILSAAAKAAGADVVRAADVRRRLAGLALPTLADARRAVAGAPALQTAPAAAAVPAAGPIEEEGHHADDSTREDAVVRGGHQADFDRGGRGRPGAGAPAHGRQEGIVAGGVRRAQVGIDGRLPAAAAGAAGATHTGRGIQNGPGARASRAHRGGPGPARPETGHDRIQARRDERVLASAIDKAREARLRKLNARLAQPDLIHRWIRLCPFPEPPDRREARRRAWVAAALRGAYGTGWLPPTVAARIVRVQVTDDGRAVVITLRGGTRIMDRPTRIDIVGTTDDVAIDELVSAVVRRGWDAVEVHGSPAFRRAVALRLAVLDPPVVVADSPLTEADQAMLERKHLTASAGPGSGPGPEGDGDHQGNWRAARFP